MLKVSFYSYKGGSGRSTTAWNTIKLLADLLKPTEKEPFVIVDTDTESAGSTFLYDAKEIFLKDSYYPSLQKRMIEIDETNYEGADNSKKEKFFNNMHAVGTFFGFPDHENKAVLLIGANLDPASSKKAEVSDDTDMDDERNKQLVENFQNNITVACNDCGAKALFFDTPSGSKFLAKVSVQESEIIVCCMRPTNQFREGTIMQLINFIEYYVGKKKPDQRKYILTPTAICIDSGQEFILDSEKHIYPTKALDKIKNQFNSDNLSEKSDTVKNAFKNNVILDMLKSTPDNIKEYPDSDDNNSVFGIPEIKRFKWFEECLGRLSKDELSNNDKMAVRRYKYLALTILKYSTDSLAREVYENER
jgi:cellulose biosynthesis protein BcsQ